MFMTILITQALISEQPSLRCGHRVLCSFSAKEIAKVCFEVTKTYFWGWIWVDEDLRFQSKLKTKIIVCEECMKGRDKQKFQVILIAMHTNALGNILYLAVTQLLQVCEYISS